MSDKQKLYVGLDVGTTDVRCVVGREMIDQSGIEILCLAKSATTGMKKGVIMQAHDIVSAVDLALDEAERLSGIRVGSATVNINGAHIEAISTKGIAAVSSPDRVIAEVDRIRAEDAAATLQLPPNREVVQLYTRSYGIDDQASVKNPIGMSGARIEADALAVTASSPHIRSIESVLSQAKISINHLSSSALAVAEIAMDAPSRQSSVGIIDIGFGTTSIAVMHEGEVEHIAVIPVGGMHITNDLAIGLKIDLVSAEDIKTGQLNLGERRTGSKKIAAPGGDIPYDVGEAYDIAASRVEELAELIDAELAKVNFSKNLPGGIIVSGGGSKVKGLLTALRTHLDLPVHLPKIESVKGVEQFNDPAYQPAIGLMVLDAILPAGSDKHIRGSTLDSVKNKSIGAIRKLRSSVKRT